MTKLPVVSDQMCPAYAKPINTLPMTSSKATIATKIPQAILFIDGILLKGTGTYFGTVSQ